MRRRPRLVSLLWRWHRRLGVFAALFVLVLVASGILLNHATRLELDRNYVGWSWLADAYGDHSADLPAYQLGEHWVFRAANGRVYFDAHEVAPCNGALVGALQIEALYYAACAQELLVITAEGELVESLSASTGLPPMLQAIGFIDDAVVIQAGGDWWLADFDAIQFDKKAPAGGAFIRQLVPDQLPEAIRKLIPRPDQWLSWERVLLDLHSGRLFGFFGVLLVDTIGVLLASLALSGTAMWVLHRRRRQTQAGDG